MCSVFGNDLHIACIFQNEEQLYQSVGFMGYFLNKLNQFGLQLNPSKSSILLRGMGARFLHLEKNII